MKLVLFFPHFTDEDSCHEICYYSWHPLLFGQLPSTAHRRLPVLPPTSSRHSHTHLFLTSTLMRSLHRDTCFCMTIAFPPEPTDTLEEELGGNVCINNLCTHSHATSHLARPLCSS